MLLRTFLNIYSPTFSLFASGRFLVSSSDGE